MRTWLLLLPLTGLLACSKDADDDGVPADFDCDDADPAIFPGAGELCDGVDNDCNGVVDDDYADDASTWYLDGDGDGYAGELFTRAACEQPEGYAASALDCDDLEALSNPEGEELCDGLDNDCDGSVDENPADPSLFYLDADGDGYGNPDAPVEACFLPSGAADNGLDCDDADPSVNPDTVRYADFDGDGYGNDDARLVSCEAPDFFVLEGGDCDDAAATSFPGADELCDGADNDCNGTVDDDFAIDAPTWYIDGDGDGYGPDSTGVVQCEGPSGTVPLGGDCDDGAIAVYPWAPETCGDGIDQDCNGVIDNTCLEEWSTSSATAFDGSVATGDYFGRRLELADFDGDGQVDILVTAYFDPAVSYAGAAFLAYGPLDANSALAADARAVGPDSSAYMGASSALSPDMDGDGSPEILLGGYSYDGGSVNVGKVYVYDSALEPLGSVVGTGYAAELGHWGLAGGDLDGDGLGDLVASTNGTDLAYVFYGPVTSDLGLSDADASVSDIEGSYRLSLADLDGDGIEDLLLGNLGTVDIFYGPLASGAELAAEDADRVLSGDPSDGFGCFNLSDDFDGDGHADLVVGARYDSVYASSAGAVYGFYGPITDADTSAAVFVMRETDSSAFLGSPSSGTLESGDLNGDGSPDLLIGTGTSDRGAYAGGALYAVYGPMGGSLDVSRADFAFSSTDSYAYLGYDGGIADLDGDGLGDVIGGASSGASTYGGVFVWWGEDLF